MFPLSGHTLLPEVCARPAVHIADDVLHVVMLSAVKPASTLNVISMHVDVTQFEGWTFM